MSHMRNAASWLLLVTALVVGCDRTHSVFGGVAPGTDVTLTTRTGHVVTGRVVENRADALVIRPVTGPIATVPRADIATLTVEPQARGASAAPNAPAPPPPATREATVPAGTRVRLRLEQAVGSDVSRVDEPVAATVAEPVVVNGVTVIPAGTRVSGTVTTVRRAGAARRPAEVGIEFTALHPAGSPQAQPVRTNPYIRRAEPPRRPGGRPREIHMSQGARIVVRLVEPVTVRVAA